MIRSGQVCFAACLLAGMSIGGQVRAQADCAEVFSLIGREAIASGSADPDPFWEQNGPFDCSPSEMGQLVFDFGAADRAEDVVSTDQLIGTWVSDNVLAVYAGLFISVYEVLTVSPGSVEGEVNITQSLIRAVDPAEDLGAGYRPVALDVVAAGRIATYGEHSAVLAEAGKLSPSRVRYHEFPLETDRNSSLAMKTGYMSFLSSLPIGVRTDGERLVFTLVERMAPGGQRIMTFRKRGDGLPEIAMLMAAVGNISMVRFHCLLEAMDRPTEAWRAALGETNQADFFAALRESDRLSIERLRINTRMRSAQTKEERQALTDTFRNISLKRAELMETGPLLILRREAQSGAPFGCPSFH